VAARRPARRHRHRPGDGRGGPPPPHLRPRGVRKFRKPTVVSCRFRNVAFLNFGAAAGGQRQNKSSE
jgi:hypothetical protein